MKAVIQRVTHASVTVDDKITDNFHIDMQSWVVTKDGEYIPFIGVYNYTGPSKRFTSSGKEINEKDKPAYIAVKVVYTDETNKTEYVSYIKQDITKIKGTFSTNQEIGMDKDGGAAIEDNRNLYIGLIIASVLGLSIAVVGFSYLWVSNKEKKNLKK